jgi:hypothetical protein
LSCQHPISAVPAGSCPACDDPADLRDYLSLPDCLDCLPDPRRGAGMRHRAAVVVLAFAVAAMITGARAVLAQKDIDAKTNEITQVKPLLDDVDITGALVTADAMHVQKETARYLVEDKKADYLFTTVKDNQPGVFAALTRWTGRTRRSGTPRITAGTAGTSPARCRCCPPPRGCSPAPPRRS